MLEILSAEKLPSSGFLLHSYGGPAEMVAKFTAAEYLSAFLAGFKTMLTNFVPAFILLGLIGFNKKTAPLLAIAATYAAVHYPLPERALKFGISWRFFD